MASKRLQLIELLKPIRSEEDAVTCEILAKGLGETANNTSTLLASLYQSDRKLYRVKKNYGKGKWAYVYWVGEVNRPETSDTYVSNAKMTHVAGTVYTLRVLDRVFLVDLSTLKEV